MMEEILRTVACERCSRRKQRCDRKIPSCSQCLRSQIECVNGRGESTMVRNDVGGVQPRGVIEIMEAQLKELREIAIEHGVTSETRATEQQPVTDRNETENCLTIEPTAQQHESQPVRGSEKEAVEEESQSRQSNIGKKAGSSEARSRRHSPDIALLSLSAMAEPTSRATEFLRGISMPGIICAITESYGGNPQNAARSDALWDRINKNIRQSTSTIPERLHLPHADVLSYVQTYYDVVDYRYPHLPREGVMQGMSAITASSEVEYESSLKQDPAKVFMAYMVLAITPLVSDTYPTAQASFISIHILSKALKILDKVFELEDGVDIIYCLILLVIYSLHSSAAGATWHLTGVAMKKCIALGFHREVTRPRHDTTEEDLEHRRWAFWLCYFLDRLASSALDRPFGVDDGYITIELPGSREPFSSNLTSEERRQIHLYQYGLLQSKITRDNGSRPSTYYLNHLLHWETSSPVHSGGYPIEQEEHFSSLLNSLSLKVITDHIISAEASNLFSSQPSPYARNPRTLASITSTNDTFFSHPIQLSEPMSCALAVIKSLTRKSMQGRSTLSWITGYTALRACMALLYCITSSRRQATLKILDSSELQECDKYLDLGMEILSVVSRQFPIMMEYRSFCSNLRSFINEQNTNNVKQAKIQWFSEMALTIGPSSIYNLAMLILKLLKDNS